MPAYTSGCLSMLSGRENQKGDEMVWGGWSGDVGRDEDGEY